MIAQMGDVANSLVQKGRLTSSTAATSHWPQAIEAEDDSMDALRRKLFTLVLSPRWSHGTEAAIDMTLLGRYYERYADHAVAVAPPDDLRRHRRAGHGPAANGANGLPPLR